MGRWFVVLRLKPSNPDKAESLESRFLSVNIFYYTYRYYYSKTVNPPHFLAHRTVLARLQIHIHSDAIHSNNGDTRGLGRDSLSTHKSSQADFAYHLVSFLKSGNSPKHDLQILAWKKVQFQSLYCINRQLLQTLNRLNFSIHHWEADFYCPSCFHYDNNYSPPR